ncbi:uncharacterized protein FPRN_15198 [Fusarium proliferatum]|nr:uncharacterized protein FPRN_15198 [Fusarium proliferatum]SCV58927.1 uncharacterized protein FFB14_15845 [Fusarium fujikuroi]
MANAEKETVN